MKRIQQPIAAFALLLAPMLSAAEPAASALPDSPLWRLEGLDQPESVLAAEDSRTLYISNIKGAPMELNGKGYISRATTDGKLVDKSWVEGLDAPKGMALRDNKLFVADMQTLHVIDTESGKILAQHKAPEAKMLNDVAVSPEGDVYVSDFIGGAIYRLQDSTFTSWFTHADIPHPNGLLWHDGALLIGSWGQGMQADFSTKVPGSLYRLDTATREFTVVPEGEQLGNLDGVASHKDSLFISDWISGEAFRLTQGAAPQKFIFKSGLADIHIHKGVLYTPMMLDGVVSAWQLP